MGQSWQNEELGSKGLHVRAISERLSLCLILVAFLPRESNHGIDIQTLKMLERERDTASRDYKYITNPGIDDIS